MRNIKHLPRAVCSSLRSSVIIFDLTRVVEELIFNSVDAGATKVYVSISIGECYIKVEDDGCGITRDGLVLLGERYATSKLQFLAEMDNGIESLGFRGEALGSLSDVSLLEVITKARGRPNGYRKVIKGCKCLFLGIDDQRQDVGTTVIVRDLFYNQPVRRKYMQCSPKKVLHSARKCVLRTALIRPQVSFKVVDIDSEDELLCTLACSSCLPLVTSSFGNEVSNSLHELNFSEGVLKLSGYLSGPVDSFSKKAFQYVYINSQYVCKGPIHKLINSLTSSSQFSFVPWKSGPEFQYGKRRRTQAFSAYMLNLHCPQSCYDLTFEPSKTMVDFKDWVPVLSFVEQAVRHCWSQIPACVLQGETCGHEDAVPANSGIWKEPDGTDLLLQDISTSNDVAKTKYRIQHHQNCLEGSLPTGSLEILPEVVDFLSLQNIRSPSEESLSNDKDVRGFQNKGGCDTQGGYCFQTMNLTACDVIETKHHHIVSPHSNKHLWDIDFLPVEDHLLSAGLAWRQAKDKVIDDLLVSKRGIESLKVNQYLGEESTESLDSQNYFIYKNGAEKISFTPGCSRWLRKPVLTSSPLMVNFPTNSTSTAKELKIQLDDFRTRTKRNAPDDNIGVLDAGYSPDSFIKSFWLEKVEDSLPLSVIRKCQMTAELDLLSSDFAKHLPCTGLRCTEESGSQNFSFSEVGGRGSIHQSTRWECCSPSSWSVSGAPFRKDGIFLDEYAPEWNSRSRRSDRYKFNSGKPMDKYIRYGTVTNSSDEEVPSSSFTNSELDFMHCFSTETNVCRRHSEKNIFGEDISSDKLYDETNWLFLESSATYNTDNYGAPACQFLSRDYNHKGGKLEDELDIRSCRKYHDLMVKPRSRSAPPFYKGKSKFSLLNNHLSTTEVGESNVQFFHKKSSVPVSSCDFKDPSQFCGVPQQYLKSIHDEDSLLCSGTHMQKEPDGTLDIKGMRKDETFVIDSNRLEDLKVTLTKWRASDLQPADYIGDAQIEGEKSNDIRDHEEDVLDISSGLLKLSGGSLVPESINKECLVNAKVLLQLDRKFIPVTAGRTLAIIDQHAADERIRLEELRRQVLSGEGNKIAYLDTEQELVLPEIGFQLLQTYHEQIKHWGWICNINAQSSGSFTKNLNLLHRRPFGLTLLAVPCILGINLSDQDLTEFLEQLAETDGSSTMPPSVLRILNFKACRGAIMFGDSLLPSECSLIVEELKETSLCFQCAHGRPTTVPLVNLDALHKQLAKLELQNGGSNITWCRLRRHEPTLKRAELRLSLAKGQC